jgi:hypothetical protein
VAYQPGTPSPPGGPRPPSSHFGVMNGGASAGADSASGTWATTSGTWHPALARTGAPTADAERRHGCRPASASPPG